jgi:hypothetical protein
LCEKLLNVGEKSLKIKENFIGSLTAGKGEKETLIRIIGEGKSIFDV